MVLAMVGKGCVCVVAGKPIGAAPLTTDEVGLLFVCILLEPPFFETEQGKLLEDTLQKMTSLLFKVPNNLEVYNHLSTCCNTHPNSGVVHAVGYSVDHFYHGLWVSTLTFELIQQV